MRENEEVLRAIDEAYPPALGTTDISEEIGVERRTAENYLKSLEDEGLVATDKIGRVRAWWLTDTGKRALYCESDSENQ
jgi:Mn-dependent DtxR family transcriptional regulator